MKDEYVRCTTEFKNTNKKHYCMVSLIVKARTHHLTSGILIYINKVRVTLQCTYSSTTRLRVLSILSERRVLLYYYNLLNIK